MTTQQKNFYDVIVLGAGAAGLMCALQAGKKGLKVLIIEQAKKIGAKILISRGGRCNFTNLNVSSDQFVSKDKNFCETALSRFPSQSFIKMVKDHKIPFHEKKLGQLFCDRSAKDIVEMLEKECLANHVEILLETKFEDLKVLSEFQATASTNFEAQTSRGLFQSRYFVVASGGLSIPQMGASGIGYEIAKKFALKIVPRHPALDGFLFENEDTEAFAALSGLSLECRVSCRGVSFRENILFTHKGISGPASLQVSLYWYPGDSIEIDLFPGDSAYDWLKKRKKSSSKMTVKNILSERLPARFCEFFCSRYLSLTQTLQDLSEEKLKEFAVQLSSWTLTPKSTVGYNKAEVTRGGVDTAELSPETLEAKKVPALFFIGEVVDVTGWLGGYNFQWAWASGYLAAQSMKGLN